jgi:hypothetical protein
LSAVVNLVPMLGAPVSLTAVRVSRLRMEVIEALE